MLILLPPSEAKRPGGSGPAVRELWKGARTQLVRTRRQILTEVRRLCAHDRTAATEALRLPPAAVDAALAANVHALDAPTLPALERYAGVLYAALDVGTLSPSARKRADRAIRIFSGAFGVLAADEPVPDYRVPAAAHLPKTGLLAATWRPVLTTALRMDDELVVDLRSADYQAMWRPQANAITVRILRESDGRRAVVSYHSKHAKGLLARALLNAPAASVDDVLDVARSLGWHAEQRAKTLDLIDAGC